jgi:hypothetical protein
LLKAITFRGNVTDRLYVSPSRDHARSNRIL